MTVGEAYRKTKDILTEAGFEAPAFEALRKKFSGLTVLRSLQRAKKLLQAKKSLRFLPS